MARKTGSHSDITGPKVREAALKLFAAHGFAAVSMRQIAAEVGVQAGALYLYTPDKQTLLFDLLADHMEALLAAWENEAGELDAGEEGAIKQLEVFARFHIRFHIDRRDAVFISYMELRNLSEENFQKLEEMRRKYEQALERILVAGQRRGQFDVADTRLTAMALISMLNGVLTWYKPDGRLSLERVEVIYADMVSKAVRMPRWKRKQLRDSKLAAE